MGDSVGPLEIKKERRLSVPFQMMLFVCVDLKVSTFKGTFPVPTALKLEHWLTPHSVEVGCDIEAVG